MTDTSPTEAKEAILKAIVKHANVAGNARAVRDVAEAYALVTGKISSTSNVEVKSG